MNCQYIVEENLLYEYADGTLAEDQAEALEQHLESCAACREEEIRLRSLMAEISALPLGSKQGDESALVETYDVWQRTKQRGTDPEETKEITDHYISALRIALATRDFPTADELIDYHLDTLMVLDPDQKNAARLVGLYARWVDMGYAHVGAGKSSLEPSRLEMVKSCLRLFPQPPRTLFCLSDIIHLRMASGYVALAEHRHEDALADFSFVAATLPEIGDPELGALAHYGSAKVYRRRGEYDKARLHVRDAMQIAREAKRPEMVAGFLILYAWLQFQKGAVHRAKELLRTAETVLRRTKDHLRLGNIQSALGRIAQREGRYYDALRYYDFALSEYGKWSRKHGHNARVRVNRAFVRRLLALRSNDRKEAEAENDLRISARTDLQKAWVLFNSLHDARGQASVKVVRALLLLDSGDFRCSDQEAEEAYQLAIDKMDIIVATRARLVQCEAENKLALKTQKGSHDQACIERALTYAQEAIALAKKTQNKRLQARTHIWRGLTLLKTSSDNYHEAKKCWERAKVLLRSRGGSYATEELEGLEEELRSKQESSLRIISSHTQPQVADEELIADKCLSADGRGR